MRIVPNPRLLRRKNVLPIGTVIGRMEITGEPFSKGEGRRARLVYPCRCQCGVERYVLSDHLKKSRPVTSCGCAPRSRRATHGETKSRLHNTRKNLIQRCCNPNNAGYAAYGGRGITVCQEWRNSYEAFRDWALANGYRDDLTIERIDVNGHYEPGNCTWISQQEQARNKRNSVHYTAFGETKRLAEWARDPRCVVNLKSLRRRLKRLDIEQAMTAPITPKNKCYLYRQY